jgi:Mn-containing catalase
MNKKDQTPVERAEITHALVNEVRRMLKDVPVEVLGHIESVAECCSGGTVALVKIDKGDPAPFLASQKKSK